MNDILSRVLRLVRMTVLSRENQKCKATVVQHTAEPLLRSLSRSGGAIEFLAVKIQFIREKIL
jgi:pimeloyl-CoA synthetase